MSERLQPVSRTRLAAAGGGLTLAGLELAAFLSSPGTVQARSNFVADCLARVDVRAEWVRPDNSVIGTAEGRRYLITWDLSNKTATLRTDGTGTSVNQERDPRTGKQEKYTEYSGSSNTRKKDKNGVERDAISYTLQSLDSGESNPSSAICGEGNTELKTIIAGPDTRVQVGVGPTFAPGQGRTLPETPAAQAPRAATAVPATATPAKPTERPTETRSTPTEPATPQTALRPGQVQSTVRAETTPQAQPTAAPLTESERLQKQIDELRKAIDEQKKINANSELVRKLDKELNDLIKAGSVAPTSNPTPTTTTPPPGTGQGPIEAFNQFRADHQNWTKILAALGILAVAGGIASRFARGRRVVVNTALFMPRGANWVYRRIRGQALPNMWP